MIDAPALPPVDNRRNNDNDLRMDARISKLEANGDSTSKMVDAMQVHMDLGFKSIRDELRTEITGLRNEMHTEITGLRNEMRSEITGLRNEMRSEIASLRSEIHIEISQLRSEIIAMRKDMNTNFRWFVGIQTTTIFALMGLWARAMQLI